jgi:mannose-6-phosphate isomerase-like protein (cupin superfamily)
MRREAPAKRAITKSVRRTPAEVEQWAEFTTFTGETEATAMKRALQRGLQAERPDQAFLAMHRGASTTEAAQIAGLPRAVFIEECLDHHVAIDGRTWSWDWSAPPTSSPLINDPPHSGSYESPSAKEKAMSISVVGPNDGEQSGGGPIRCRIIEDGTHTQHRLGLIEAMVPPGPAGPPQHLHRDHDETFIVTEGKLRFTSGADSVDVEAGSCVTVPAGTPHTFANPFGEAAKFICTLTPDLYVDYFRALGKLPVDERGLLDPADVGRTMAAYATEVIR